jgi:methylated-DNA-[protein]-cysteine S-methyltransferase
MTGSGTHGKTTNEVPAGKSTCLDTEEGEWGGRSGCDCLQEARSQLAAYFKGKLRCFDLPLVFWGTPFQRTVWRKLLKIPYGQTVTYSELARRVGNPSALRAVGAACGRNPLSIVVPCHRVVGADGRLTGYAGGLVAKRQLLELEAGQLDLPGDSSRRHPI